ncbi:TPA: Mrp/NBP35 family ATP-binding protein [bacterium]|jgi:Mrp family chromosome partitioning ATPase|nr:Mrp/NBP35 family ATP-binding protein [bacterium]
MSRPIFPIKLNDRSNIKKVYAVVSGKGGVGKSLVTSLLATSVAKRGKQVAVLDADITGPSIPKLFGLKTNALGSEEGIYPVKSNLGIDIMSINLVLDNESDPVIWRGPILGQAVSQLWSDVIWSNEDVMFIDLPPGTGDITLTIFQSIPLDGIIIVTSPQELVSMIVEKAVKMAQKMDIDIVGIVENMSYFVCENCDTKHEIYGESHIEEIAASYGIKNIAKIPINPAYAQLGDVGLIEEADTTHLDAIVSKLNI